MNETAESRFTFHTLLYMMVSVGVYMGAKIVIFWRCLRFVSTPPSHFRAALTLLLPVVYRCFELALFSKDDELELDDEAQIEE